MPLHKPTVGHHLECNTQFSLLCPQKDRASTQGDVIYGLPGLERGEMGVEGLSEEQERRDEQSRLEV